MDHPAISLLSAIFIGLGATLTFDLWAQFLKHAFKITPSNICLVGRWLRCMPEGTFNHAHIASTPQKRAECVIGWIGHYTIGIIFSFAFLAFAGSNWLQHPTLIPAIAFGIVTVVAPFFIMQPLMGLGYAASKVPHPAQARIRSLLNHTAFGVGLYFFAQIFAFVDPEQFFSFVKY